jgi:phage/plasmid-like protein (TIGR03299 family)
MIATTSAIDLTPVRPNPWTKIGQPIDLRETDDRTVLARAGLNWRTSLRGLYTDSFNPVPGHRAVVRDDLGIALGVVGDSYTPVQNEQMLGLIRALAAQAPVTVETGGSFKKGAVTFMQARMPDLDLRLGSDVTRSYFMLSNSNDGQRPLVAGFTTVRAICANTLALAIKEVKSNRSRTDLMRGYAIRHTSGITTALGDMLNAYKSAIDGHRQTHDLYQHLAATPLTKQLEKSFFDRIFAAEGPDESARAASLKKARDERLQQILSGVTSRVPGTVGTAFALFQSAIEYVDAFRPSKRGDNEDIESARLFSATFGSGMALKRKAVETIAELTAA